MYDVIIKYPSDPFLDAYDPIHEKVCFSLRLHHRGCYIYSSSSSSSAATAWAAMPGNGVSWWGKKKSRIRVL